MDEEHFLVSSRRPRRLASKIKDERYRNGYVEAHNRRTLVQQMREFRGSESQTEFGRRLGISQQVVSRLEDPNYRGWSASTFFSIARKLGVAAIMRFVDFPTFIKYSNDLSEEAMHPRPYDQVAVDEFVVEHERATEKIVSGNNAGQKMTIIYPTPANATPRNDNGPAMSSAAVAGS
jgi:hypothetical protein